MSNLISIEKLAISFNDAGFVLKTQRQLAKDFGTAQFDFRDDFVTNALAYDALIDEVKGALAEIVKQGESGFLQLLYTIDVKESEFLAQTTQDNFLENMAQIVIRREAYKVFLRQQFS